MPVPDVYKILKDLELKAVGLDPKTNEMQSGYFCAFRDIGLPIHKDDYDNPWSPLGGNLDKAVPQTPPADPATAPTTGSSQLDPKAKFSAAIARSQQTYLNAFMLTDDKLRMNGSYSVMPSAGHVSDAWWAIITGANGIPTESVISDDLKAAYDAARGKLMDAEGNPTAHYNAYMQYEDQYKDKVKDWHRAYAGAFTDPMKLQAWPIEGTEYENDANEAWDRWVSFGFKMEIENAIATLAAQGTDPAIALISRAKKRFENSLNTFQSVGQIPYTMMLPESWYDQNDNSGWTTYTSSDLHSESHYTASGSSWSGSAGLSLGFVSFGGTASHSEERTNLTVSSDNLDISFSYCTVDIKRPWLEASLLSLQNWFLMGDYKKGCISNGSFGQEKPEGGILPTFLPSIVTSLILMKDLRIKWAASSSDVDTLTKATSGGGGLMFGPFMCGGSYSSHSEERNFTCDANSEGLFVEGIQLIGYVSAINPQSPGVDSSAYLKKPDAAGTPVVPAPAGPVDDAMPAPAPVAAPVQ
jgi:hypothetical protein